ncbi:MAG: hypothetical protein HFACDABA_01920 [Anaerolineales bacterium]|nr:hypothetical protein [Anaerolineales bacterium]
MFILITTLFLFLTALALMVLHVTRPGFRYGWLAAMGGAFLAWISVLLWQMFMPIELNLPAWEPALFRDAPSFAADRLAWPYAFGLASFVLAFLLRAVALAEVPDLPGWAGVLALTAFGILAVLANNPLTLALVWAALDITELAAQIRAVQGERANEQVVSFFAARAAGIVILILAGMVSLSSGSALDFQTVHPNVTLLLILAAGIRLSLAPLLVSPTAAAGHEFNLALQLTGTAASLVLLARTPAQAAQSPLTPFLLLVTAGAALYGSLQWIRATEESRARPFWMITISSLAVACALRGNPVGSVAWGVALVFTGGALFLSGAQNKTILRILLVFGVWGLSSLPFSPTASVWQSSAPPAWADWIALPALLVAQAMLIAGFIRRATLASNIESPESQPGWAKNIRPIGVGLLLLGLLLLGFFGWDGSLTIGSPLASVTAGALAAALYWLRPRLAFLNPVRAHWVQPANAPRPNLFTDTLQGWSRQSGRFSHFLAALLEGEGGILWALLFLVLFLSLLSTGTQP